MTELGPSTEQEMILAFLLAEIDSPRFGQQYQSHLAAARLDKTQLIGQPDLSNSTDNALRAVLLSCVRGYGANSALFAGFPSDVDWRRVSLTRPELARVKYANYWTWFILSRNTRLVGDGVANLGKPWGYPNGIKEKIDEIEMNVKPIFYTFALSKFKNMRIYGVF